MPSSSQGHINFSFLHRFKKKPPVFPPRDLQSVSAYSNKDKAKPCVSLLLWRCPSSSYQAWSKQADEAGRSAEHCSCKHRSTELIVWCGFGGLFVLKDRMVTNMHLVHTYTHATHTYTHMHIHVHIYMHICIHTCTGTCTSVYVCVCVHMHKHTGTTEKWFNYQRPWVKT